MAATSIGSENAVGSQSKRDWQTIRIHINRHANRHEQIHRKKKKRRLAFSVLAYMKYVVSWVETSRAFRLLVFCSADLTVMHELRSILPCGVSYSDCIVWKRKQTDHTVG